MSGGGAGAAVAAIQRHLEAIYAVQAGHEIQRFLIDDATVDELVQVGVLGPEHVGADEQVLVLPGQDGGVELALHLGDEVQSGLASSPSLQDHCHATEGVSHVMMLLRAARAQRPVRLLDLEFQAEVDKAATCLLLRLGTPTRAEALLHRLFGDGVDLDPRLSVEERARYREAHRLGARYAGLLADRLADGVDRLLAELRRFYRLTPEGKRARARAA